MPNTSQQSSKVYGPPRKIMLIDDNPDVRKALSLGLEFFGHQVTQCAHGEEAISALSAPDLCRPDVVIIDQGLPGMSGTEVAQAIRDLKFEITPTLALLTGSDGAELRAEALASGITHFLKKPLGIHQLAQWIAEIEFNQPTS